MLQLVTEFSSRKAWQQDGCCSMADWLVARLGVGRRTADDVVRVAGRLNELPVMAGELSDGALSFDQAKAASQLASVETDAETTEYAKANTVAHLEGLVRLNRGVPKHDDDERRRRRSLWWRWDHEHGWLRLGGQLADVDGAKVVAAIERMAKDAPADPVSGLYEPYESRCADALVALAGQSLADISDTDVDTVVVHVDAKTMTGQLDNGITISQITAQRLLCDTKCQLVFQAADGKPVGVGRTTREPPRWLRRMVRHRDRTCRFPGCGRSRWTEVHHLRYWSRNGPTDLENLGLLCCYHHGLIHTQGWKIEGDANGPLTFIRDSRHILTGRPPPLRPDIRQRTLDHYLDGTA